MTVPAGLLYDLARERQADLHREALHAGQRALIRAARPQRLTARITRWLTAPAVVTSPRPRGVDLRAVNTSLATAKEQP